MSFQSYLSKVGDSSPTTKHVRALWAEIQRLVPNMPEPGAILSEDGCMYLWWRAQCYILDVEVYEPGSVEWWWRDRDTDDSYGDEDPQPLFPIADCWIDRLREIAGSP